MQEDRSQCSNKRRPVMPFIRCFTVC